MNALDRAAMIAGEWALRRLFVCDGCATMDVRDEFPGESDVDCLGCQAMRIIKQMRELRT